MWVSVSEYVSGLSLRDWMFSSKDAGTLNGVTVRSHHRVRRAVHPALPRSGLLPRRPACRQRTHRRQEDGEGAGLARTSIDLERCIPLSYIRDAPKYVDDPTLQVDVLVATRFWDFKVFIESVVSLAEACRVGGGRVAEPWAAANPPQPEPATEEEKRFQRGVAFAVRILGMYSGNDQSKNPAMWNFARSWIIRSFYIKRNVDALPAAIQAQMSLRAAVIRDGEQKDFFFRTLRESRAYHLSTPINNDD